MKDCLVTNNHKTSMCVLLFVVNEKRCHHSCLAQKPISATGHLWTVGYTDLFSLFSIPVLFFPVLCGAKVKSLRLRCRPRPRPMPKFWPPGQWSSMTFRKFLLSNYENVNCKDILVTNDLGSLKTPHRPNISMLQKYVGIIKVNILPSVVIIVFICTYVQSY